MAQAALADGGRRPRARGARYGRERGAHLPLARRDDADSDTAWTRLPEDAAARTLPRGDVKAFPSVGGDILVAPLLAVERGHNIVLRDGKAAIGTVYFLARPHPRPDDIALAIQSINDWAVRQLRDADGSFRQNALAAATPDQAAVAFRSRARRQWNRFLTRRLAWSSLRRGLVGRPAPDRHAAGASAHAR